MKSPLNVSYQDLIDATEARLKWMEVSYPGMKQQGKINEWTARKNIEVQKTLLRLLKKHKKDQQLNLNEMFDKL